MAKKAATKKRVAKTRLFAFKTEADGVNIYVSKGAVQVIPTGYKAVDAKGNRIYASTELCSSVCNAVPQFKKLKQGELVEISSVEVGESLGVISNPDED